MACIEEQWKPVVGYEGYYEVSSLGRMRGISRVTKRPRKPLSPYDRKGEYPQIRVWIKRKKVTKLSVHIAVMAAFVGRRPAGLVINHKDGNKWNNVLTNLEYVTYAENRQHALMTGLAKRLPVSNPIKMYALAVEQGLSPEAWAFGLAIAATATGVDISRLKF